MLRRKFLFMTLLLLFILIPVVHAQDVTPILYGDRIRGKITDPANGVLYEFDGRKGDVITATLSSDQIDVYMRLGDSKGNLLAENDDVSNTNLNASIEFTLPENGQYVLVALGYDAGPYTLSLEVSGAAPGGDSEILTYGDSVSGQALNMDTPVVYIFSGEAGDAVNISLTSDVVDTYLVLADENGNTITDNDDVDNSNVNSYVEAVLPANGDYLIGVFAYDAGPFDLVLQTGSGTGGAPVSDTGGQSDVLSDTINNDQYFVEYPLSGVTEGQTITIETQATSGDLDLYVGLFYGDTVVAENDDRDKNTTDSYLEFPQAQAGDYTIVITRYGFEQGETSGQFEATIKVGRSTTNIVSTGTTVNPVASGYPAITPAPNIADWTVLVYMGGDNNLEDGLENDLDEFERAGGSTDTVRILALFDRSDVYSRANGDWSSTRIFEPGQDTSDDAQFNYPPTIDSREVADLGELDTAYGNNLLDFLVWGMQTYPAQRYAIILNDHGGAWYGTVTDETTGRGILDIPALSQVFDAALKNSGREKFDLLINDSCLMSGIEHYAAMARYFDYALGSPEITLNPSFDMDLMTQMLNQNPNIAVEQLGELLVDKYMEDMQELSPDTAPVLGAAVTDLRTFDSITSALGRFTEVVSSNPGAYISELGQVRANTYAYSFFLPEDQFGPATNVDIGDFMNRVARTSKDQALSDAAQDVFNALGRVRVYSKAGTQLERFSTFYNIYFPARSTDFDPAYFQQTPLQDWAQMLRTFYGGASPQSRAFRGPAGAPSAAPSVVPSVSITNVFPDETSIALPITISMEVTGRNISEGKFTVDQIQSDGTALRLDSSRIITNVVIDNVAQQINQWNPGVDDSDFTWNTEIPVVTDGTTSSYELVATTEGVSSIAGRYQFPGQEQWIEVTVIFNDDGGTASLVSRSPGSTALANLRPEVDGQFQAYRSVVTADGRIELQPGTVFDWPEEGIRFDMSPAPSGQYHLGFLIEAVGGITGFGSTTVAVNNDDAEAALRGYVDDDWGFVMQRPTAWFDVTYFPDPGFLQTSKRDETEYLFVYPVASTDGDLSAAVNTFLDDYNLTFDGGETDITVDNETALEFRFSYTNDTGDFLGRAFAVYRPDNELVLIFSSEATSEESADTNYQLVLDYLFFFDAQSIKDADTGVWTRDSISDIARYPVRENWMPGAEEGVWWKYRPDDKADSTTFAGVLYMDFVTLDSKGLMDFLLQPEIPSKPNFVAQGQETYYGEKETWEALYFTHEGPNGEAITGRLYTTVKEGVPYALWFEAPTEEFNLLFRDVFTIMLDGFTIDSTAETTA
jgi:Clostripain family/Bacterial pre-peptidase C-terminal domain